MRRKFKTIWVGSLGKAILYGLTLFHLLLNSGAAIPDVVVFEEIGVVRGQNILCIRVNFIEWCWVVSILWSDEGLRGSERRCCCGHGVSEWVDIGDWLKLRELRRW